MKLAEHHKRRIAAELQRQGVKGAKLKAALKQIDAAMQQYELDMSTESAARWHDARIIDEHTVELFIPKPRGRGRIPEPAQRNYVRSLVLIYERATGKQMKRLREPVWEISQRRYDDAPKDQKPQMPKQVQKDLPDPFLVLCLRAANVHRMVKRVWDWHYPRSKVQDVLHELRPHDKRGRPKKGE